MKLVDLLMQPTKAMQRYSPLHEGLTEGQENELIWMYNRVREGEHRARVRDERTYATSDPVVREAYKQDAATFPGDVDKLVKRTPGAVVMPRSRGELLELLRFARDNSIPVIPRGGGTGVHGGCVPVEGGVVADLRGLDDIVSIDEDEKTVRVQPGITWLDLEQALNEQGLATLAHPINAPMSTVGGAIAMGTGGFGGFANGAIRDHIVQVRILTPDLEIETLTGEDLDLVVGCQGTTGFILDATLQVREHLPVTPVAAAFDDIETVQSYMDGLLRQGVDSVHVLDPDQVALKMEGLGVMRKLPKKQFVVLTTIADEEPDDLVEDLEARCEALEGEWVGEEGANWEWDTRFQHRAFKRFGPSMVVAEGVVPRTNIAKAFHQAEDAIEAPEYSLWAVAIASDEMLLVAQILCDERLPSFPLATGSRLAFMDAVKKVGGRAVAPGLLSPGEAKDVLGKDRLKRVKAFKKERDPSHIMNPGKVLPARVKGMPLLSTRTALGPGLSVMKRMRGQFDHRRESTTEPSNRALRTVYGRRLSKRLARIADDLYKCSRLGHTNRVGDLHRGISFEKEKPRTIVRANRFDTQLPRGILAAGRAILEGAEPTRQLVGHALSLPAVPTYETRSMNEAPVLEAIEGVREAAQAAAGLDDRVLDITKVLEETSNVMGEPDEERSAWMPGGAPSGVDTSTLLLAGDTACYQRTDDAKASFNVLANAGFGFTTLGPSEVHPGTIPYRLGAFDAAQRTAQAFVTAAEDKLGGQLPSTLLAMSSEDADVLRRRLPDLLEDADDEHIESYQPRVVTVTEAIAQLVSSGRLTFQGAGDEDDEAEGDEGDDEQAADEEDAQAEEPGSEDDEAAEGSSEEDADEASEEETSTESDEQGGEAAFEELSVTLLHSPFATDDERDALETVADAIPGLSITGTAPEDLLVPDAAFQLTHPEATEALVSAAKQRVSGTVLVGCTDLANVLDANGMDILTLPSIVQERMQVREGGAVTVEVEEEEEEGFKEFEIPDGAYRVELVKEEAAIPVFPDESILDAAEAKGFDLPFDCRAGSCVTCCAKWEGSSPDQSDAQAISDDEKESHCLTCVAKPTGDVKIWSGESP